MLAMNDALYATPDRRDLQDILTCIREGVTIQSAGRKLLVNAERYLKSAAGNGAAISAGPQKLLRKRNIFSPASVSTSAN